MPPTSEANFRCLVQYHIAEWMVGTQLRVSRLTRQLACTKGRCARNLKPIFACLGASLCGIWISCLIPILWGGDRVDIVGQERLYLAVSVFFHSLGSDGRF